MKKVLMNIVSLVIIVSVVVIILSALGGKQGENYVYKGNTAHKAVDIKPNEYQCSECNMNVEKLEYVAELISKDGDTYFFDDIGCLVLWLEKHKIDIAKMLTQTLDTHQWIEPEKAWYTRTANTPMGSGFAAFSKKKDDLISYEEMRLLMLQGKNLNDPFVKKALLKE